MIDAIRSFFTERMSAPDRDPQHAGDALALASAALMIEVMRADAGVDDRERERIRAVLHERFRLTDADLDRLEQLAAQEVEEATDLYQFTTLISEHYGQEDRITLVRHMWAVAWADGDVDRLEEHIIRRVAELLHVRHGDFIAAKLAERPA